ncbi:MAG TPA: hypothetical protein VHC96_00400 [Puia sp.]|jgi:Tfp pilus assembly protein PilN|nr:hypothetical protein [Puia sp.]
MISKIRDKILRTDRCIGVSITLLPEDKCQVTAVVLKLHKNRILKEKEFQLLASLENLYKKTGGKWPVAAVVNGKGVLQKKFPLESLPSHPLEAVLPNANPHDFYFSVLRSRNTASISIVRKEVLDRIAGTLEQLGFKLLDISTGITVIPGLLPFLNLEKEQPLFAPPFLLRLGHDKELLDVENAVPGDIDIGRMEYNLGDQYVNAGALLAFGAGMALMASDLRQSPPLASPGILRQRQDYIYYRYYRSALMALLTGLFCMLLVNFLVYSHYFSKNQEWQNSDLMSRQQQERVQRSGRTLHAREQFLINAGWMPPSRISFCADRIAGLVPSGTLLTSMKINPSGARQAGEETIHFRQDTIQVMGLCEDPTELNQFSNNLKNVQDFKEVSIRNYLYKKESGTGVFFMEIILK